MVSRSLLALFAIALFFAVASAVAEEESVTEVDDLGFDEDAERGLKEMAKKAALAVIKKVAKFLKKEISKVDTKCISAIYDTCDINPIMHPKKYYKCAKKYFEEHKDECYHSE